MKLSKLLIVVGLFPAISFSGEKIATEIYCDDTKTIVSSLKKDYDEMPIILGKAADVAKSTMSIWINPVEKTWTILATKGDRSCIVGVGEDFKILPLPKQYL